MAWVPLALGLGIAGAAVGGRYVLRGLRNMKNKKLGGVSKNFYDGGFQAEMNRREAALILGCRESSSKKVVQNRYRTLMRLNHPDFGGSPYVATKINEAKELLASRAKDDTKDK